MKSRVVLAGSVCLRIAPPLGYPGSSRSAGSEVMFYEALSRRGYVIYPGKLTVADSFHVGCIGRLGEAEMHGALVAMTVALEEMGVTDCGPVTVAGRTA